MKVSALEGLDLDYWVGLAVGLFLEWDESCDCWGYKPVGDEQDTATNPMPRQWGTVLWVSFTPSKHWHSGGPLIEEYRVALLAPEPGGPWGAEQGANSYGLGTKATGRTPLEAACRAIVASVYGDAVPEGEE